MGTRLSLVGLAVVLAFATGAVAVGPGPGPIAPGPNGPNGDAVQVEGTITVDGGTLFVDGVEVDVTDCTVIIGDDSYTGPDGLDALQALLEEMDEVYVVVCGCLDDYDVLVAERINVKYVGQ